jgi:hypothetical protein
MVRRLFPGAKGIRTAGPPWGRVALSRGSVQPRKAKSPVLKASPSWGGREFATCREAFSRAQSCDSFAGGTETANPSSPAAESVLVKVLSYP